MGERIDEILDEIEELADEARALVGEREEDDDEPDEEGGEIDENGIFLQDGNFGIDSTRDLAWSREWQLNYEPIQPGSNETRTKLFVVLALILGISGTTLNVDSVRNLVSKATSKVTQVLDQEESK